MLYMRSNNPLMSYRGKKAGTRLIFVTLAFLLTVANASLYAESTTQKIRISYEESVLSIWVNDADLKEVLYELADETNINVRLPLSLKQKITINKSGISLNEGLEDLLKNLNYIILYSGVKNNMPLISNVIIFPKNTKSKTLTDNGMDSANGEIQSVKREIRSANRIIAYERQIESLKKRLSKVDENSRRGINYSKRIKRLEKLIEKHESQLN